MRNRITYREAVAKAFPLNVRKFVKFLLTGPFNSRNPSIALIRGTFYIIFFKMFKPNVRIRFPFLAFHKVSITGPGSVSIAEHCNVQKNVFRGMTIVTLRKEAQVTIGKHCILGGVTIRCFDKIEVGDRALVAHSLIQDTPFLEMRMVSPAPGEERHCCLPISIGKNVWIGMQVCVLGGSILRDDSVISLGSILYNNTIAEYCIASGSPVITSLRIERLLNLLKWDT